MFIQQECIDLIKSDFQGIYNVTKQIYFFNETVNKYILNKDKRNAVFKLSIHQRILKKMYRFFHKKF